MKSAKNVPMANQQNISPTERNGMIQSYENRN